MTLRESLEAVRKEHDLPALGAIAVVDGVPTEPIVVGVRRYGYPEPALATDRFHIGSDTKAMTAALIGQLIDRKQLAFTTTLGDLLAKPLKTMDSAWNTITVHQLLCHLAGLETLQPRGKTFDAMHHYSGSPSAARQNWLKERLQEKPDKTLGEFKYSNAGYTILGAIVEIVMGKPWERVIAEQLWKPLGITSAGFGAPPELWEHTREGKKTTPISPAERADNPPLMAPAGMVHLSLRDWATFVAIYADPTHQKILQPETIAAMQTMPRMGNYNGGWVLLPARNANGPALTHAGSNTMNYCVGVVLPKRRFAALVATNLYFSGIETVCDQVLPMIAKQYLFPKSTPQ